MMDCSMRTSPHICPFLICLIWGQIMPGTLHARSQGKAPVAKVTKKAAGKESGAGTGGTAKRLTARASAAKRPKYAGDPSVFLPSRIIIFKILLTVRLMSLQISATH